MTNTAQTRDMLDTAAHCFVHKLQAATDLRGSQWHVVHDMGESAGTICRAVERGWVILQEVSGSPLKRSAALTEEGRRLGRSPTLG